MDRLLRLAARKYADSLPTTGGPQPRDWSPVPGRSTLITSAPKSPSSMAQYGPASASVISTTRIESRKVSTGSTLVLLDRLDINFLAAFVLASRLNLLGNSMARANRGCDVWGRENEKTIVCVFCLDARAGACLAGVGTVADHCGNRPGRCRG